MIHQRAQQDELAHGKPGSGNDGEGACHRVEHPIGNLVGSSVRLSDQEVVDAIMLMGADDQHRLADQRVKWITDNCFECEKPGTMAPARTRAPRIGHCSPR
jgi:hypothetical protein